nr:hypothetical protein [Tanacetum cinerariifolium]
MFPPPAQVYSPPKKDMSWTGLLEFVDDTVTDYSRPSPSIESNSSDLQNSNSSISEHGESSESIMTKHMIKFVKAADSPTVSKTNKAETARKPPVKYAEMYRNTSKSPKVRGNQQNWNNLKSQQLGKDFLMKNKACFKCGHFNHLAYDCGVRVNKGKTWPKNNYTHKKDLFKENQQLELNFEFQTVNTKFPTVDTKFSTVKSTFTAGLGNKGKAAKASACWIWRPKQNTTDKGPDSNSVSTNSQNIIDDKRYWDNGCSRHMTGNISYLFDYEPYDGGYVSFGQGGGKITSKGIIKTDFKLKDDTNVLLRTPRKHNMYSIDLNNIVPHKDLTCLVIKASTDESILWHRRLGHLNFKTMNKLVRHNLVKGLPSKCFKNDHTFVACLKGKQHKASYKTKVLVNKSQNKTPYELFNGRTPAIGFLKSFGCHVMILNTLDHLGKFDAKGDKGYFVGYSMTSKAFRVFNKRTKKVKENLHVDLLENKIIEKGVSLNWLFDIDTLTNSMNYVPVVVAGTPSINFLDTCNADAPKSSGNSNPIATSKNPPADQMEILTVESAIPTVSSPVLTACLETSLETTSVTRLISKRVISQDETPSLDNILTLSNRFEYILGVTTNTVDTNGVESDLSNMESIIPASPTPTFRIHKDHPKSQIISPVDTPEEPKKIFDPLKDPCWVNAMQEELLQFKIQNVWILVDYPKGMRPIGTKWVLKNKKDERGIVIRNKARLVAQGHTQEEGINYEEVFTPVARIDAIRLFLAYASFIGFTVYQIDVKSAFLYGTIDEEVYMMQPPGFQDPKFPDRVYKVEKAIRCLSESTEEISYLFKCMLMILSLDHQIHSYEEFEALMHDKFQMSVMGELNFFLGLQVLQKKDGIFLSQDKYIGDILKKFGYSDVRFMIGSLMSLTTSRPDTMFAVCACARHKVTPKECHLHAIDRIFRYLKGHPKLGLWYPKESPFDLVAYLDSDYGGATQDRKSTTRGCQFLGRRLISWQCKKQIIVAISTTEVEYVAAASGCGQVLLAFCDYHNMIAILEKLEHNVDFHQIVDFVEASYIRVKAQELQLSPHHTPCPEAQQSPHHDSSSSSHPTKTIPTETLTEIHTLRQYSKRATRIAQSKALPTAADEPASLFRDDRQREAFPTVFGLEARQDRENIIQTSALPHDSPPRVTSLDADEDSMQQQLYELIDLCTHLQRQQAEMVTKIAAQDLEISNLKARIMLFEDKDKGTAELSGDDAPMKGRSLETGEEAGVTPEKF